MQSSASRIVIGGGSGFIGSTLRRLLLNEGYKVSFISRLPYPDELTWEHVDFNGFPEDTAAVINVAGENMMNPFKKFTTPFVLDLVESRVGTTHILTKAINKAVNRPKLFVSMSGVGIYRPSKEKEYDEYSDIPNESFDFLSHLALAWENAAQTVADDVRLVTLRSGVVLGRDGGMVKRMFLPFYFGLGGPIGDGQQFLPWIHIHDLCRLILLAVKNDQVKGVVNGVAPQIITNGEFTKAFAKSLRRPAIFPMPAFVLKKIFGEERAVVMLEGQKVIPKKAAEEYKFKYWYPNINEACDEMAKFFYLPPKIKGGDLQNV